MIRLIKNIFKNKEYKYKKVKLETLPINRNFNYSDYKSSNSFSLSSYKFWLDYVFSYDKWFEKCYGLGSIDYKEFNNVFGKETFSFKSEHKWYCWVITLHHNESLIILNSKESGTIFEVISNSTSIYTPTISKESEGMVIDIIMNINDKLAIPLNTFQ